MSFNYFNSDINNGYNRINNGYIYRYNSGNNNNNDNNDEYNNKYDSKYYSNNNRGKLFLVISSVFVINIVAIKFVINNI